MRKVLFLTSDLLQVTPYSMNFMVQCFNIKSLKMTYFRSKHIALLGIWTVCLTKIVVSRLKVVLLTHNS